MWTEYSMESSNTKVSSGMERMMTFLPSSRRMKPDAPLRALSMAFFSASSCSMTEIYTLAYFRSRVRSTLRMVNISGILGSLISLRIMASNPRRSSSACRLALS